MIHKKVHIVVDLPLKMPVIKILRSETLLRVVSPLKARAVSEQMGDSLTQRGPSGILKNDYAQV